MLYRLTIVLMTAGLFGAVVGCENRAARERTIAEETEIEEGFFGDTEVERRELRERNGQYELREETTTIDPEGRVEEQETRIERPNRGTEVNVDGGREGVNVDVDVRRDRD
jgi:hypothetical protein